MATTSDQKSGADKPGAEKSATAAADSGASAHKPGTALVPAAERGSTTIADAVVAKIAGIAAREIGGVYALGGTTERAVGRVREILPGSTNVSQGIAVEVGERQVAVDVEIVAEYGVPIHQLAAAIRRNIVSAIEKLTGLEVTEVNVTVHDVHLDGDDDDADNEPKTPRVQ